MNMNWFRNTKKNTDNDSEDSKKNDDSILDIIKQMSHK